MVSRPRFSCKFMAAALVCTSSAPFAQSRSDENAVTQAEDAFGFSVGRESLGIYNAGNARGFSPAAAGNLRIEGLYFDQIWGLSSTLLDSTSIKVGLSAQGYPFAAPSGIVDQSLRVVAEEAIRGLSSPPRLVVSGDRDTEYERLVAAAAPLRQEVADEMAMMALNYTSGTTGRPKGVMCSHRGAYLQALAMVSHLGLTARSKFLWTLPMFHCNGWTLPWAVTAAGGRHVALERPDPDVIWDALRDGVTHLCAAPTVLTRLAGGCRLPVAAFARVEGAQLSLEAAIAAPDGRRIETAAGKGLITDAESLGKSLAEDLLGRAADLIRGAQER